MRVAILVISDRASKREYEDKTGPALATLLDDHEIAAIKILPDRRDLIAAELREISGNDIADIIITAGGTGLSSRDVTPEATQDVIEREIPGLAEAMRAAGRATTSMADLSRQVVGQLQKSIIVNLPGSPKGAVESLTAIIETLPHAVELIRATP